MKTKKIKTYVLIVSREFPSTHAKKGGKTGFIEHILDGSKIHTIRSNYDLWAKRIKEVQEGEAIISLRYWSGKPYRSEQFEFLRLDKDSDVGVQLLSDTFFGLRNIDYFIPVKEKILSENDGLSLEDFKEWFKIYDLSKAMAIIHFTKFRYT